eukprot:scaffold11972_cov134-Amphora_coffeaeformis.AAC.2
MVALATAGSNDIAIAPFFQYETSVATSSSPAVPATAMNETATKEAAIVPFSNAEPVLQGVQAAVPATNGTASVPFFSIRNRCCKEFIPHLLQWALSYSWWFVCCCGQAMLYD